MRGICKVLILAMCAGLWLGCGFSAQSASATKKTKEVRHIAYSVQVGSFSVAENAGRFMDSLNLKGLDAFLFKDASSYKVRFGNYQSLELAKSAAKSYKEQGLIGDYFIISPQTYTINRLEKLDSTLTSKVREDIVRSANGYIGVPYKWGGDSEHGFDCSGLTRAVYLLNGIEIPRSSKEQFKNGKNISKAKLKKGDLVFFNINAKKRQIDHVGIYIGDNEFIHAPSKGKFVSKAKLDSTYWVKTYMGARSFL